MVNLNRQIAVARARQGGYSARVLPEPVGYQPAAGGWGMGWLAEVWGPFDQWVPWMEVFAFSGDGRVQAPTIRNGSADPRNPSLTGVYPLPVAQDVMVVLLHERNSRGFAGDDDRMNGDDYWFVPQDPNSPSGLTRPYRRQGYLISHTDASIIDVPESLAIYHMSLYNTFGQVAVTTGWDNDSWTWRSGNAFADLDDVNVSLPFPSPELVWETAAFNSNWGEVWPGTGAFVGDTTPADTLWRPSLAATSRFADALDQVPIVMAAGEGSVWFNGFDGSDSRPYRLERKVGDGEWEQWGAAKLTSAPRASWTPLWRRPSIDPPGLRFGTVFTPLISVAFSDRRAWFQSEHGMTIP